MESNILLVDDVRLFLEIQKEFLQNSPAKIATAKNGKEALHAIAIQRPDLIFMDLEMPEMNGVDCCRAIKSNSDTAAIPVVMITARGDEASRVNCRLAGCDDTLTKPLERILFLETARRFLTDTERREARKQINVLGVFRSRGTTFPCALSNLSLGGAFVTTDFNGEVGRIIQISVTFSDGSEIDCQAKICWLKRSRAGSPLGFGVNFVLLPMKTKDILINFLEREI